MISQAQQMPMFTQYMLNDFSINPAIAGTHDYYQVKNNYRIQWAGIVDAPRTYMLSVYGPHKTMDMGFGGYIFSDNAGLFSQNGIYGAYAYNISITSDMRISGGISVGMIQYKIPLTTIEYDRDQLGFDPLLEQDFQQFIPDASIGVYVYSSQYFGGISTQHVFMNRIDINDTIDSGNKATARLKMHTFLYGGYKYLLSRDFDLEPTIMFKQVSTSGIQVDISVRAIYQKLAWAGLAFRTSDAASFMLGYNHNDMIHVGIAYDYTFSPLRTQTSGSWEFLIGVRFRDVKKSTARRRLRQRQ